LLRAGAQLGRAAPPPEGLGRRRPGDWERPLVRGTPAGLHRRLPAAAGPRRAGDGASRLAASCHPLSPHLAASHRISPGRLAITRHPAIAASHLGRAAAQIFAVFTCRDLTPPGAGADACEKYLEADYSVSCCDWGYVLFRCFALALLLAVPVGVPAGMAWMLRRARRDAVRELAAEEVRAAPPHAPHVTCSTPWPRDVLHGFGGAPIKITSVSQW
jgi:hypothetical protein